MVVEKSSIDSFKNQLEQGIADLNLSINVAQIKQLIHYTEMLLKWNRVYSLTAITSLDKVVVYHLLDGLAITSHLRNYQSIIDVGSGMGVPGVIIAICYPDKFVCVIDCNQKKTAFLQQVAIELGLSNLNVVCGKVEGYKPLKKYDLAISRAFTDAKLFIEKTWHLGLTSLMLMKSKKVQNEVFNIQGYLYELIKLSLPGSLDERYLLKIDLENAKKHNSSS